MNRSAVVYALLSAVLFGLSTPAAKVLLGSVHPAVLAGLLYCGAGLGIALLRHFLPAVISRAPETSLARADLPWLAGAITSGGIVGPLLLMTGLAWTAASTASLLLTLESAATAVLAWFVFHENFDRRIALGMVCLIAGAAVLSWSEAPALDSLVGPLAIIAACLAWGLDNNLTRKVSLADPLQIVELKGLIAGPFNLVLGLWIGGVIPGISFALVAGVRGLFRIWGEPRSLYHGAASPRHRANRCVLLHCAIHRRCCRRDRAGRTGHGAACPGGRFDGAWGVAASDRASRA